MGLARQLGACFGSEAGSDEQHGIGSHHTSLQQLVAVYDELLAQDGDVDQRAGSVDVRERTAEVGGVGQDGEGTGSGSLVGGVTSLTWAFW